jgi:hypothetical protein
MGTTGRFHNGPRQKKFRELVVDRRFDLVARKPQHHAVVQRLAQAAGATCSGEAAVVAISDADGATRPAGDMIEEIYRAAVDIRLDLIYSTTIGGDLRKRWANRLGEIKLRARTAAAEIDRLRAELAVYERILDGAPAPDVQLISHRLWRLQQLCLRQADNAQSR